MAQAGTGQGRRDPTIWQQFRRRRVLRTVLLYLALVLLAVEAYLFLAELVAFPPWGFRAVVGAAVLGFPFVVVLAWTYDVTPSGIVRTPEEPGPDAPISPGLRMGWLFVATGALVAALLLRVLRN